MVIFWGTCATGTMPQQIVASIVPILEMMQLK